VRAARHDGIAGVQHSERYGLPKTTRSGAKGPGGESEAHRGLGLGQNARMMTGGEVLRRRRIGFSWVGGYRRPPMFWSPWITSGAACEGVQGVKMDQRTPAAMNRDGGAAHRRQLRRKFPSMQRRRAQLLRSGSFWMARGSGRGGCGGLGHGGAA
jgi:hypothetical protein